jgi:hypothetical protein
VRQNPPPPSPVEVRARIDRILGGPGVRGNERLTGQEERVDFTEQLAAAIRQTASSSFIVQDEMIPLLEDYPPAEKKKPKDYQKQGYKAPILVPGKRRINLKDLK